MDEENNRDLRLEDLFNPLFNALYEIQEHEFYGPHAYYFIRIVNVIEPDIYNFIPEKKEKVISLLLLAIKQIKKIIDENESYQENNDFWDVDDSEKVLPENILENLNEGFQVLNIVLEKINRLTVLYDDKPSENSIQHEKIVTELSVKELALLFRLLADEKKIRINVRKYFFQALSSAFETEGADSPSYIQIGKYYRSPDFDAAHKIQKLLEDLQEGIKKYI